MNHFSQQQLNKIFSLIREIEKLTDVEKLFLYLHLPCGKSDSLIEGGKLRSNGRLRAGVGAQKQSNPLQSPTESTSSSSSTTFSGLEPSSPNGPQLETLSDFQKQLEQMPKRPDQETTQTYTWILSHLEVDPNVSLPKQEVYEEYKNFCQMNQFEPLCVADFGKAMKYAFPCIKPRRLGQRGNSRYCYSGLRKRYKLEPPSLPNMELDSRITHVNQDQPVIMDAMTSNRHESSSAGLLCNANKRPGCSTNSLVSIDRLAQTVQEIEQAALLCNSPSAPTTIVRGYTSHTNYNNPLSASQFENSQMNTFNNNEPNNHQKSLTSSAMNRYPQSTIPNANIFNSNNTNNSIMNLDIHRHDHRDHLHHPPQDHNHQNPDQPNNDTNNLTSVTDTVQMGPHRQDNIHQLNQTSHINDNSIFRQQLPATITNNITTVMQQPSLPLYEQPNSNPQLPVQGTSCTLTNVLRPGTPDDDDYCHNYLYINSQNNIIQQQTSSNGNENVANNYQTRNDCLSNHCNETGSIAHNSSNSININYVSHYRHHGNLNLQSPQRHSTTRIGDHLEQQQHHHHHDSRNNQITQKQIHNQNQNQPQRDRNYESVEQNNGMQFQDHHHHHHHNQQEVDTNSLNAVGTTYRVQNNDMNNYNDGVLIASDDSYNLAQKSVMSVDQPMSFKHSNSDENRIINDQRQIVNHIPFNLFALDTCVSSPFQSPASTPYPSHLMIPTSYEPATDQADTNNGDQNSMISAAGIPSQNHYMTT